LFFAMLLILRPAAQAIVEKLETNQNKEYHCKGKTAEQKHGTRDEEHGEEQAGEEPNYVYAESVEWIKKGFRDIIRWRRPRTLKGWLGQRSGLLLARTATHRFAYLALFVMAIAPWMLFSTWWAWQAYDGRHSTKEMGAMLFEIYEFSFESWTKNIEMPSMLSLWELTDLTAEGFLSMLVELDAFEFTPPEVLLKRSRLLSSLSAPLAIAKGLITVVQKIRALCLSEGKGIKTKQISAGASAEGLRLMGFTPRECVDMGCSDEQMRVAGFSASEFKDDDFDAQRLHFMGFSARELMERGFSAEEIKHASFSTEELKDVGLHIVGQ
jgi:hypothetical protein